MADIIVTQKLSPAKLRKVVLGQDETISRRAAMTLLREADLPDKPQVLAQVLMDESDDASMRHLAAVTLYQLNVPESSEALLAASQEVQDARVLESVVTVLGRIGDERALAPLSVIQQGSAGRLSARAEFAGALIAHRLGLEGHELPFPTEAELLKVDGQPTHAFTFEQAPSDAAQVCLKSLAVEPLGITYSEEFMYQFDCLPGISHMVLINPEFAGSDGVEKLGTRKAMCAVVASKIQETGLYSTAFLMLTSAVEGSDQVRVLGHRPWGDPLFAGMGQIQEKELKFAMHAVSRAGGFPIQAEGVFKAGQIEITLALTGTRVQGRRAPSPG